jgi:molybdopterin molybdotransferase
VALAEAAGRVLTEPVVAARAQPPFPTATMDGYAVAAGTAMPGARFTVIGEAPAGASFSGRVGPGEAVRIFTGAPVPEGAAQVVIQEDVTREGDVVVLGDGVDGKANIRPVGADFGVGDRIEAPRRLRPADLALIAAMNVPRLRVARRPVVAILATGDELVMPGEAPGPDQIIASNAFAIRALAEAEGAEARVLPIARDRMDSLTTAFDMASDADLLLTIGGASVGDHDLVGQAAAECGFGRAFYKVAMRPGKPLMAGKRGSTVLIGLPGNPVSSIVCTHVFVLPVLRAMLGEPPSPAPRRQGTLAAPLSPNGPREHYMRARLGPEGVRAFDSQDSALLNILSEADALIVRPPGDPARAAGETVDYVAI